MQLGSDLPAGKKSRVSRLLTLLGVLVLVIAAGILGWLYYTERDNRMQLENQVTTLNAKKDDVVAAPAVTAEAKYAAAVGKFNLTLNNDYSIVVDLDGGFEGGPATQLFIAKDNPAGSQTVSAPSHARVDIFAVPLGVGNTYASRVESETTDSGTEVKKLEPVTIDGVSAEVYQLDGLFVYKKYLFQKNDIFYSITLGSADSSDSQTVLGDVIKESKFNL